MPDLSAEGGQDEADACKRSATKSCRLASAGPSSGKKREQEGHRKVYDAVKGGANDTSNSTTPLQRPIIRIIFLEDTIAHGEACVCK